jgi:queuine/archaeosine tRNA-ribosyltransferase
MLGAMLLTLHNLRFFHEIFARMRDAIRVDRLPELRAEILPLMTDKLRPE